MYYEKKMNVKPLYANLCLIYIHMLILVQTQPQQPIYEIFKIKS